MLTSSSFNFTKTGPGGWLEGQWMLGAVLYSSNKLNELCNGGATTTAP